MAACPISTVINAAIIQTTTVKAMQRRFWWMMAICLFGAGALGVAQVASAPQSGTAGGYRIAGTVVSKTDAHPLARARIFVRDAKDRQKFQSMVTAEDGKFEFSGLPAGKYSLEGTKRGFISAAYDQHERFSTAIVTGAGLDTERLVLRLAPDAVITGKVLDEVGDPVRGAMVTLFYDDHSEGVDQVRSFRSAQADDQGTYEITPVIPGTYFLAASARPWYALPPGPQPANSEPVDRSLDVAYPVTYYADVTDPDSATAIPVRGGERVEVDIHLTPVPALRLLFHVGEGGEGGSPYPRLEQPSFDGSTPVQNSGVRNVSPGVFEITGIPAGRYNVRVGGRGSDFQMNGVDLSKDGQEVETSNSEALSSVKVSVQVPGEGSLPPHLMVALRSGHREPAASQDVNSKGEVEFPPVVAGRYEVLVWGSVKPYSIARMAAEGAEVSGHTLTLTGGASASVSLTLVSGSAEVQGTVKRAGTAFAGAMVVLVPKSPETDRSLFRRDQSDLDGTFSLRGVVPGSYTVLAIENGWDLDWSQPGVIGAYLKGGRTIEVVNQGSRPINLAEPIEVQTK